MEIVDILALNPKSLIFCCRTQVFRLSNAVKIKACKNYVFAALKHFVFGASKL